MNSKISRILIEFVSIVFAVLLALVLNQWRENEATKKKVGRVLDNIRQEIALNDSLTRKSYDYRMSLLKEMEEGDHQIFSIPLANLEFDSENDARLARELEVSLLFYNHSYYDRVEVRRAEGKRILILGENVFDIRTKNDTLLVFGVGGIQLRSADLSLHSFEIAQATGVLVELDLELVEELSRLNNLIENYQSTSNDAISFIYQGKQTGIISSMQDMLYFESQIIEVNKSTLELLKGNSGQDN